MSGTVTNKEKSLDIDTAVSKLIDGEFASFIYTKL